MYREICSQCEPEVTIEKKRFDVYTVNRKWQSKKKTQRNSMYREICNRQISGESASLPQYLGCNTVFDMRLRVTFLRRKTVSLQSNIAHRE